LPATARHAYSRLMAADSDRGHVPIVDAHHHVWDLAVRAQPWLDTDEVLAPLRRRFSSADLAPQAAAAGVVSSVVVQTVTEPTETPELLALAGTDPLVAAVVGWTDLTAPGVADALAELRARPSGQFLVGIRHPLLTEPDPDWIARPEVRRGLAAVAAAGLTFDLVLQPDRLPAAVLAAAEVPELTFVLDHLGNVDVTSTAEPDEAWAESFSALAALPNTVCKLSGILGEPGSPDMASPEPGEAGGPGPGEAGGQEPSVAQLRPYFDLAMARFGPQRLMFGSDWPVCTLTAQYRDVVAAALALTADLSAPEQEAILAGTARATYRIPAG
jgi:L-fuconolactonase